MGYSSEKALELGIAIKHPKIMDLMIPDEHKRPCNNCDKIMLKTNLPTSVRMTECQEADVEAGFWSYFSCPDCYYSEWIETNPLDEIGN